jgi:hypothetical protein
MRRLLASIVAAGVVTGAFPAGATDFKWSGNGHPGPPPQCPIMRLTISASVEGNQLKGQFKIEGVEGHPFSATIGDDGKFTTTTTDAKGSRVDLSGNLYSGAPTFTLNWLCTFTGEMEVVSGERITTWARADATPARPGQWSGWLDCQGAARIPVSGTTQGSTVTFMGKDLEGSFISESGEIRVDVSMPSQSARGRLVGQIGPQGLAAQGPVHSDRGDAACSLSLARR